MAVALDTRRSSPRRAAAGRALRRREQRAPGVRAHGRRLDLLGLEGRLLRQRRRCARLLRRALLHAGGADLRAQLAAMVQHRPALGLRHRRSGPGPLVRRPSRRRGPSLLFRLRAAAAARLLHPERRRRPGGRRRHHGPVGARGAPVQVRLGHRLQLLPPARRGRAAVGRRQVVRPDVVPQDRRSRGGRHQVGRHDAPRGQDGVGRHRPSRHRAVHRLEDARGAEGGRAGRRLPARQPAPQRGDAGLPRRRRRGRVRSAQEPDAAPRRSSPPGRPRCPRTTSSASSSSPARVIGTSSSRPSTPIGSRRPTSASRARTPTTPSASATPSCAPSSRTANGR